MITNAEITIFNARYRAEDRTEVLYTEVLYPTHVQNASYLESEAVDTNDGVLTEQAVYKIRIPYLGAVIENGRQYLPERRYRVEADVSGSWTLRKGDFIVLGAYEGASPLTSSELAEWARVNGLALISVTEYADNTIRGSDAVKHWRIGGK